MGVGGDHGWGWGWVRRVHSVAMINFVCFDFLMFVMFENHNFFQYELELKDLSIS